MDCYIAIMTHEPCSSAVRAWACLNRAQQAAMGQVERALKAAGLPPLAWYEVLVELERAGGCGLRPFALEEALLLPQYGLSRLLARMEAAGLVARGSCPDDRRGQLVALTDAGRAVRERMWPVYAAAVQAAVGARLSQDEAEALAELLGRLAASPAPQRGTGGPGAALSE
jgi:DNA-binding MarR family transcriptional regulator